MDACPCRYPWQAASQRKLNVFNGIGPPELLIVLVIVLVIFGPKRLPGLGRSLGSGMREFRDSITGKGSSRDDDDEDDAGESGAETRKQANAALGRSEEEAAPVEGEVVSERTRS
jgi:sec-independent protein translocase protein TatA